MKRIIFIIIAVCITVSAFSQDKKEVKCRIWKPTSFCDIPDSLTGIYGVYCNDCSWKIEPCKDIDSIGGMTGVWITFPEKYKKRFNLTTEFNNVSLIKKNDGKILHPKALIYSYNYDKGTEKSQIYMPSEFRAQKYVVKLKRKEKFDLILLFPSAEKGDRIVIENYVDVKIQE